VTTVAKANRRHFDARRTLTWNRKSKQNQMLSKPWEACFEMNALLA
jgi:hypothetical protein